VHAVAEPLIVPAVAAPVTVTVAVADVVPQVLVTEYEMIAVPTATPRTAPVAMFTDDTEGLLLLQLPPAVASASVVVPPLQTVVVPVMAATEGAPFTVTIAVAVPVPQLLDTV
jgi:hypothetical protein